MAFETATNPETGDRIININGEWKPIEQSATNKHGQKAYLVGGEWLTPDIKTEKVPGILDTLETVIAGGTRPFQKMVDVAGGLVTGATDSLFNRARGKTPAAEKWAQDVAQRTADYQRQYGEDPLAQTMEFYTGTGVTAPVGGVIAKPLFAAAAKAPAAAKFITPVATAIESGGFRTGLPVGTSKTLELGTRALGGAVTGGASAAMLGEDAGTGATIGAVVPTVGAGVVKKIAEGYGWGKDLVTGKLSDVKAGIIARDALGDNLNAALIALKNAPDGKTPAQVLREAGIDADPFMALEAFAKRQDTNSWYRKLSETQRGEMSNVIGKMAKGATETESKLAAEKSLNALNTNLIPQGKNALRQANIGGKAATEMLSPENIATLQTGGVPSLTAAPAIEQAKSRLSDLALQGQKPIDTSVLVGSIRSKLSDPTLGPSDVNANVLNKVANKIEEWTAKGGGVIDANALYSIRKNAVNEEVQRLLGGASPTAQSKLAAKLLGEINPAIDNAIETAGGKGWVKYLKSYETGRQGLEQKELASKLKTMLDNGQDQQVIDLIRGRNPAAVEAVFGPGSYDIFTEMAPKMTKLNKIANNLERDISIKEQAQAGVGGLKRIMEEDQPWFRRFPSFLSPKTATANMALEILENKVNQKVKGIFEEGFKSGKNISDILETLPAKDRSKVLSVLRNSKEWNSAVTRGFSIEGAKNNLAPEYENRNALTR